MNVPLLLQSIRGWGKRYVWQDVVASGLLRNGRGPTESGSLTSVSSPCESLVWSDTWQSSSGSNCFSFLPFSLMGSSHLVDEMLNQSDYYELYVENNEVFAQRPINDFYICAIKVILLLTSNAFSVIIYLAWFPRLRLLGTWSRWTRLSIGQTQFQGLS